jgi:hypothetical protein
MTQFLVSNWLSLLSLAVALFGGVPGIVAVLEYFRRGPEFGVTIPNFITGERVADAKRRTMMLLTLTVWNRGETPITPATFDLDAKVKGRWLRFDRCLIPENAKFEGKGQEILAHAGPSSDLQRFKGSITRDKPAYGHLMFDTGRVSRTCLRDIGSIPIRVICNDASGREHRFQLTLRGEKVTVAMEYPQHGLVITPGPGSDAEKHDID